MRLFYVRHGYPSYNPDCLTPRGKYEAEKTADYLKNCGIEKIISSDSNRAFETASFLAKKLDLDITRYHCLNESISFHYFSCLENGKEAWTFFTKRYMDLYRKHEEDSDWMNSTDFANSKISEGFATISMEVDKILLSLNIKHDRKDKTYTAIGKYPNAVAIFAHGGMGMAVVPSLLDENFCFFCSKHIDLGTCAIAELDIDLENSHKIKLIRYNHIVYDLKEAEKYSIKL